MQIMLLNDLLLFLRKIIANYYMNKNFYPNSCTVYQTTIDCFNYLTPKEIQEVENNQVEVLFKKGETIAKQGSFASYIILLTEGLIKIYVENANETLILKIVSQGNLIGLPALFEDKNVFPYSVLTYKNSTAKLIDINIFKKLIKENSKFSYEVMKIISSNAIQVYGRFFCFEKKQSYGRLADIILCLSNNIFRNYKFTLPLSRKELAELAGMSSESVIRILKKFKDEGLIKENCNTIEIIDPERLTKISQHG